MGVGSSELKRGNLGRSLRGRAGEDAAASALLESGWKILARNYWARLGEIDIVGMKDDTLVFFEVKAWSKNSKEDLPFALNSRKRHKIIETSKIFLVKHRQYNDTRIRYDVLFFGKDGTVTQYEGAFVEGL